ncbi:MAG: DUF1846 domain-containing protein [Ruthenibacterium lactatiformans]
MTTAFISTSRRSISASALRRGGKLYLEFGGKLFDDYHAARVLRFDPNGKIRLLYEMREQAEIIFTVSAGDIENKNARGSRHQL